MRSNKPLGSSTASRPNFDAVRLQVEYMAPRQVRVPNRRLRKHPETQIRELAAGIDRHGFNVPLLIDDKFMLVSGHARLAAAELLGLEQVPVIQISHLTDEQLRLFAIFENKIGEKAEWDEAALSLEFDELRLSDPEIELTDSGFMIGEIDAMAGRIRTAALDDLSGVYEPDPKQPVVSRLGDLWLCGRHRVVCGDSTDAAVIARLVGESRIRQIIGDCPYNLPTRTFSSSGRHGDFVAGAGEMSSEEFTAFLASATEAAKPVLTDGALIYYFMDHRHIAELIAAGHAAGLAYKQLLVWVKSTAGMGSFYRSGHELVGVFKYGDGKHRNGIMLGQFGRNRSNVLSYAGVMGMSGGKKALKLHPSVKNVALIADLMLDASGPGEAILDNFGGAGTTLIAAEKVDRTAYLSELSPAFVDVIVQRFDALGAGQARLEATGQTFAQVLAERLAPPSEER